MPSAPRSHAAGGIPAGDLLDVGADRAKWRAWLRRNHAKRDHVWLVAWRASSGRPRIPYAAAVEEALCYGWIDSQQKTVDADRVAQRYTPRRPGSGVSETNKVRVRRLLASGRMTRAGLAALAGVFDPGAKPTAVRLPPDVRQALKADAAAWRNYAQLPDDYKRIRLAYIESGRRHGADHVARRIANFVAKTAAGKRIGHDPSIR